MARTAIAIIDQDTLGLSVDADFVTNGTAIDATNNHSIAATKYQSGRLLLVWYNTTGSTKILTIKAGVYPEAAQADLGDLAISCLTDTGHAVLLEKSRFQQSDGSIDIDVAASMTGYIAVVNLDVH